MAFEKNLDIQEELRTSAPEIGTAIGPDATAAFEPVGAPANPTEHAGSESLYAAVADPAEEDEDLADEDEDDDLEDDEDEDEDPDEEDLEDDEGDLDDEDDDELEYEDDDEDEDDEDEDEDDV